jgi:TetR/AcrR family transcriptional repressor of nem operon
MMARAKNETRERLVETARQLFLRQGYTATGVAQILAEAGVNSGSLYYFFPTKEDLLLAVLEHYKELLCPRVLRPVYDRLSDPIERVFGVLHGYRELLIASDWREGCPIGNLALELSATHPAARRLIAENFSAWRDAVAECLRRAADRLPAGVRPDQLALFVLTLMEGAVMLARTYRSIEPYDNAVTQLRDYLERLLADGTTWSAPKRAQASPRKPRARIRRGTAPRKRSP